MPLPERERGAALLTVLLLVAVIAVIAGTALERVRIATRLAGNAAGGAQARAWAGAAETLATTRIDTLLGQQPDRVALVGGWSDRPFALPVPNGLATARVTDGTNCFNLNSLVSRVGPGNYAANPAMVLQFARLLRLVGVPAGVGSGIAAAASDWIDTDTVEQPGGAEDGAYLARDPPYRAADTLMADPSELRAVAGVTPEIYAAARPWICALPLAEPSVINVDTLTPEQAPLLAMLALDTLSVPQARAALLRRPAEGWATTDELWRQLALGGVTAAAGQEQTVVSTGWFKLAIDVRVGDATLHESGVIDARRLPSRLVARQWRDGA